MNEKEPTPPASASPIVRQIPGNVFQGLLLHLAMSFESFLVGPRELQDDYTHLENVLLLTRDEVKKQANFSPFDDKLFDELRNEFLDILNSLKPPKE